MKSNAITTINWLDNLRVIATISVIILHVSGFLTSRYTTLPSSHWWIGNIADSLVRFCVPVFLMITGALLLSKPINSISHFLKKRFLRIIFPFLFWSLIYTTYTLLIKWYHNEIVLSNFIEVSNYIFIQIRDGAYFHLWYIYLIIGIYLFIPIISKWTYYSTKNQILYYIVIWISILIINIPFFSYLKPNIDFLYFSGYLGYVILGYFLTLKFDNEKHFNKIGILLFVIGVSVTIIGTFIFTKTDQKMNFYFYDYLSLNVLVASVGVFLMFRNVELKNKFVVKLFKLINKYSYGIYLSHVIALSLIERTSGIDCDFIHPLIGIPLTTLLCIALSFIITYCINKLPFGKYVSG